VGAAEKASVLTARQADRIAMALVENFMLVVFLVNDCLFCCCFLVWIC
jgi:hypothetical protein